MAGTKPGKPREKNDGRGRLGGRQKGTPNKSTGEIRKRLLQFTEESWDEAMRAWHMIEDPDKKFKLWVDALAYNVARLTAVELKDTTETKTYQDELDELEDS